MKTPKLNKKERLEKQSDFIGNLQADLIHLAIKHSDEEIQNRKDSANSKVRVGNLHHVCAGGRHGYFESGVGLIRKPINNLI